jgi:hypothetical protein
MGKQIEDEIANWRRIVEANNIKVEEMARTWPGARPGRFHAARPCAQPGGPRRLDQTNSMHRGIHPRARGEETP